MAFIFVPNAEGGFDEGDRQTNPDTGVEYIYIDGAWRPLGPKIEDEFDTLDGRYVNKSGDTVTGDLVFNKEGTQPNLRIQPGNVTTNTTFYQLNSGIFRIRSTADSSNTTQVNTHIAIGKNTDDGTPYTQIYHVQDPAEEAWVANKRYVDTQIAEAVGDINLDTKYLPLTGGEMTGDIDMMGARIDFFNSSGEQTMEIAQSGFIKSRDMLRVVRGDNGPILEGRTSDNPSDTTIIIRADGRYDFHGRGTLRSDVILRTNSRMIFRGAGNSDVGYVYAADDNELEIGAYGSKHVQIKNLNAPSDNLDAVPKVYVDSLVAPFQTAEDVQDAIDAETVHLPLSGGSLSGQVLGNYSISNSANSKVLTTKEYVDRVIAEIKPKPAQLAWKYKTGSSTSDPGAGYFRIANDGSNTYYRLSLRTANGVDLNNSPFADTRVTIDYGPVGCIWFWSESSQAWKLKQQFRLDYFRWNYNNHMEFKRTSKHGNSDTSFTPDYFYYFTVGGFF